MYLKNFGMIISMFWCLRILFSNKDISSDMQTSQRQISPNTEKNTEFEKKYWGFSPKIRGKIRGMYRYSGLLIHQNAIYTFAQFININFCAILVGKRRIICRKIMFKMRIFTIKWVQERVTLFWHIIGGGRNLRSRMRSCWSCFLNMYNIIFKIIIFPLKK